MKVNSDTNTLYYPNHSPAKNSFQPVKASTVPYIIEINEINYSKEVPDLSDYEYPSTSTLPLLFATESRSFNYSRAITNLSTQVARKVGVHQGQLHAVTFDFFKHLNDENFDAYSRTIKTAGYNADVFVDTANQLYDSQNPDESLSEYLSFTSSLSPEVLNDFLNVVNNDKSELRNTMGIASQLTGDGLNAYLSTAATTGENVKQFNAEVNLMLKTGESPENMETFLKAADKVGTDAMSFIAVSKNISDNSMIKMSEFILEKFAEMNLSRFIQIAANTDENTILSFINKAMGMDESEINGLFRDG